MRDDRRETAPSWLLTDPLNEAMHSEHISKERSDAQNVVSRFSLWDATLLHNPRRSRAPFFIICGVSHHHPLNLLNPLNPHTEGVSNEPSCRRCVQSCSRKGGGERSEPIRRMPIITYDTER